MPTETTIGRYEVIAPLGQGAMGAVYKAIDPLIERTVAIKTIHLNLSKEEHAEFEERFYREAKSAGRLNHSNIVTIYDVGEANDVAYIAMEYIEGESLREVLDSGVVLPLGLISKIAARVASALHYAHQNGVVHRDIKPANIMITPSRDVKIMDFGIAQIPTGSRTQLGTVLGSPKYMAPEQVAGGATDGRTDIFALGVVLYEMLTGTTPFNADNLSAIMFKILNETPVAPSTLNPRVPPALDRIVARALARRPQDRYQTAREFSGDLRNQEARLPAGERTAALTALAAARKQPAGPQDATVLLTPELARETRDGAVAAPGVRGLSHPLVDSFLAQPPARRALIIAGPLLLVALIAAFGQWRSTARNADPAKLGPALAETRAPAPVEVIPPLLKGVPKPGEAPPLGARPGPSAGAAAMAETADGVDPTTPARPVPLALSTVAFAISPWGEIIIDDKRVGIAPPLTTLQLESGRHAVEVRNPGFAPYRQTVNLRPGQTLKIKHKFR